MTLKYTGPVLTKVLTDQSGWSRFFRKLEIFKKLKKKKKNESKTDDHSPFKITNIYFQKRLEGSLPKYAPSFLGAIDYQVYWPSIINLSSIGF